MDAKDKSNCSQAIRTRRLTALLTGVMCATRTNTLILGQSLILTLKTSFSKQNNHTSEVSNQLLLDVVTWTAIFWMTDRLPAVGYIFHKSVPCAKMRHPSPPGGGPCISNLSLSCSALYIIVVMLSVFAWSLHCLLRWLATSSNVHWRPSVALIDNSGVWY